MLIQAYVGSTHEDVENILYMYFLALKKIQHVKTKPLISMNFMFIRLKYIIV